MALYIRFLQFYDVLLVRRAGAAVASQSLAKMGRPGSGRPEQKNWYLLISNHHSWADIVVLCVLFRKHIPMNKYFLKQQLAWVPFIGLACWALDMPFMRRYSRSYLIRHPERRGKDVETTRRSCEKFRAHPTTIVNFVEGSRFTEEKSAKRALLTTTCYRRKPLVSPWRSTYSVRSSINC